MPLPHRLLSAPLLAMLLASSVSIASAQQPDAARQAAASDSDAETLKFFDQLAGMASHHPNELFRIYGAKAAAMGRWGDAAQHFRTAARYADKYSQHRLSILYWQGVGVPQDRVQAYIWADLAAERGYPQFLGIREKMWAELSAEERAQVATRGQAMYDEYGDPTAKRRFRSAMTKAKAQITGSRTGFVGFLRVSGAGIGSNRPVGLLGRDDFYARQRMSAAEYWATEDRVWKDASVQIGDIERVSAPPEAATPNP